MRENINISREEGDIQQLLHDKHTLLEGYITEDLFKKQFLDNTDRRYTMGWWSATVNNKRYFFAVKELLNDLDQQIIKLIPKTDEFWQVKSNGDNLIFKNAEREVSKEEFLRIRQLTKRRQSMVATPATRVSERQEKCIAYFKTNNLIRKIANERYFANNFLTQYFEGMVNIDCFLQNQQGELFIFEIKFKYESRDGCFGINVGQLDLFTYFIPLGFHITHIILYNHKKDKELSITRFIELPGDKYWLYAELNDIENLGIGIAPEETSVSGSFKQPYYKIDKAEIQKRIKLKV